jgi:hypothetical protein
MATRANRVPTAVTALALAVSHAAALGLAAGGGELEAAALEWESATPGTLVSSQAPPPARELASDPPLVAM